MRKIKSFILEFKDYQDSDSKEKNIFFIEYSFTSAVFSIEILMGEIELVVAENYFDYRSI